VAEAADPEPDWQPQQPYRLVLAPGARRALGQALPPTVAFAAGQFVSGPLVERPRLGLSWVNRDRGADIQPSP
jgi:hypothetical protein